MTTIKNEMLSYGKIVLLKFPFTDGQKYKKRPALLLHNTKDGDIIVCRITGRLYNTEFDFQIANYKECGLRLPSVIRLHKIATIEKSIVEQTIGTIDEKLKHTIKQKFSDILKND